MKTVGEAQLTVSWSEANLIVKALGLLIAMPASAVETLDAQELRAKIRKAFRAR